jgi:hypothetical protein
MKKCVLFSHAQRLGTDVHAPRLRTSGRAVSCPGGALERRASAPRAVLPWWSVMDVLDVPALQLGHPVLLLILMEADNGPFRSHAWATARSHHALDRGLDMTPITSRG